MFTEHLPCSRGSMSPGPSSPPFRVMGCFGGPHCNCRSRPILVQHHPEETLCPVHLCSALAGGMGVGQEGSWSSAVQQASDKAQRSCKTGSQKAGTQVCGWCGVEASNTENHTRAQLRKRRRGGVTSEETTWGCLTLG